MARILTFLTGRNLPKITHAAGPTPPVVTEQAIRDFTRIVEAERLLESDRIAARQSAAIKAEMEHLERLFIR